MPPSSTTGSVSQHSQNHHPHSPSPPACCHTRKHLMGSRVPPAPAASRLPSEHLLLHLASPGLQLLGADREPRRGHVWPVPGRERGAAQVPARSQDRCDRPRTALCTLLPPEQWVSTTPACGDSRFCALACVGGGDEQRSSTTARATCTCSTSSRPPAPHTRAGPSCGRSTMSSR